MRYDLKFIGYWRPFEFAQRFCSFAVLAPFDPDKPVISPLGFLGRLPSGEFHNHDSVTTC